MSAPAVRVNPEVVKMATAQLAAAPLSGERWTPGMAPVVAPPPREEAGSGLHFLDALALMLQQTGHWIRSNLPHALLFGIVGFVVGWLCNVVLLAVVYNGVGSAPPGGPALGPNNRGAGSLFWLLLPALVSGLVSYRLQVGKQRFRADLRGFPKSLVVLARHNPSASTERILWGFGGAMLVAALLAPALSGVFAVGALVVSGRLLGPLFGALVSSIYRTVVARFAPARLHPPSEAALQLALLGSTVALLGGLLVSNPVAKLGLAVVAIVAAVLFNRRVPAARQAAVATLVIGGAVMLAISRGTGAFACDGGLADCGGSVVAWLACGAGPVLSFANQAAILAGGGSILGGGMGSFDPHQWDNPRLKAAQEWRQQNPNAPWSDFYDTSQGPSTVDSVRDLLFGSAGFLTLKNLQHTGQWVLDVGEGGVAAVKGLYEAADFWLTPDSLASAETRALRESMMKDIWGSNWEGAKETLKQMGAMFDTLVTALHNGDANTVQKILGNFGGNMLAGSAIGLGQEAMMGKMLGALRAAQGLDIAGKPLPGGGIPDAAPVAPPDAVPPPAPDPPPPAPEPVVHDHVVNDMPMDPKQQALLDHPIKDTQPLGALPRDPITGEVTQNINAVYKVEFGGGKTGFYKPLSGEDATFTGTGAYGEMWRSEVGAYHVDQALGFNRVPVTAAFEGKSGVGSIQELAPSDRLPSGGYTEAQQQQMGVLDYVLGNGDRHPGNWLSHADGSPAAIDNGATFPDPAAANPNADIVIRSDFVLDNVGKPLDPAVLDAVRHVDQGALADQLRSTGVSETAIQQSMARLQEIADTGQITGKTWMQQGGGFLDSAKTKISYNLNDWMQLGPR